MSILEKKGGNMSAVMPSLEDFFSLNGSIPDFDFIDRAYLFAYTDTEELRALIEELIN